MIRARSLTFTYRGAREPAVRELSFEVEAGEIFGFLGPSGAGKSTTQNVLIGLLPGWRGDVEVLDAPLEQWGVDYYHQIGVSFEMPNHYSKLTARENLELFRALHDGDCEPVEAVLEMVELRDAIDVRVGDFSKGMKQRLTFARSLLHRPRLWFLDEPTAGLDPINARRIMDIIDAKRAEGVTAFLTTHDMTVADQLCDRVAFIVGGRLAAVDAPATLRHRYGRREVRVTWNADDGPHSADFPLDGLESDRGFLETLASNRIESIHSQETTLEDVFIKVTGSALT